MNSEPVDWHRGKLYSRESFSVPPGYRLGDGVFETIRTYYGKAFRLGTHLSRLLDGAKSIGLRSLPAYDAVLDEVSRTLEEKSSGNPGGEWVLRPTFFSDDQNWGFIIPIESWVPRNFSRGNDRISVGISEYRHPGRYLVPPSFEKQVKWLSRGPLSHALRDARDRGWEEALLLDPEQRVIEGSRSNVFAVYEGAITAPGVLSGAFPGITREVVLECAERRGMRISDKPVDLEELQDSGEVFLTSTLLGIAPVTTLVVGRNTYTKTEGEISGQLLSDFKNEVMKECSPGSSSDDH